MPKPPQRSAFAAFLTPAAPGEDLEGARLLPLDLIQPNPSQPRQHADRDRLAELQTDIAAHGILQPLVVRPLGNDRYEVVAGERRYRAALALDLPAVPCLIREMDEATARAASIRENVHRDDMDPEDEGRYYQSLQEAGLSLREIAQAIGKSHQYVYRRVQLVERPGALLAYREGRANLEDLVGGQRDIGQEVAMTELGNGPHVAPPGTGTAPEETETPRDPGRGEGAGVTERYTPGATRPFTRRPTILKPFQSLALHVQRITPDAMPTDQQAALRHTVDELIQYLMSLRERLEGEGTSEKASAAPIKES